MAFVAFSATQLQVSVSGLLYIKCVVRREQLIVIPINKPLYCVYRYYVFGLSLNQKTCKMWKSTVGSDCYNFHVITVAAAPMTPRSQTLSPAQYLLE